MYPKRLKVLPEPTEEVAEKIWILLDCDKKKREEVYHVLKDWLQTQPHLPKDIDESKYLQTYGWCKNSLERTKSTIDMYYTLRAALPEIYANRDPTSERLQKLFTLGAYIPLPRLTEKYERVCMLRGMAPDLSEMDAEDAIKMVFMVTDIRAKYDVAVGDIYIVDMCNFTAPVLAKFTPALLKKIAVLCLIHVHPEGLDSLHSFVDKKYLPKELGGEVGTSQELWDGWKETLIEFRDWFLEQENVKTDESKRPVKHLVSDDLFGFEGSFRQLSMD